MTAPAAVVAENPFVDFLNRYRADWVALVREVFGADPDADQRAVLEAACRGVRRISWRSGHGVGKSTTLSWVIACHILTRYPQRTKCTAPTEGQLFGVLAADVKALLKHLQPALYDLLEIKVESIHLKAAPEESYVSFGTSRPETPEALAGVHSANTLLIADEASGVHDAVFEAASGSMSGHHAVTILAGNPVRTSGLFFDTHHKLRDTWLALHTSCVGHPRIAPDFISDMQRRYGEESNAYRVRVLGEFPKADDDTIIPYELVEAALTRDVKPNPGAPIIWGVDVARQGSDASAIAKRKGNVLLEKTFAWRVPDLMQVAGRVKAEYDACGVGEKPSEINIDANGWGAGTYDRLRELGLPVRAINVSETAAQSEQYHLIRTELWFRGRDWFAARDCSIAGDDALVAELIQQRYGYLSNGKWRALSKDEMKVPSPNRADAFLLTLASDHITLAHGSRSSAAYHQPLKRVIKGLI